MLSTDYFKKIRPYLFSLPSILMIGFILRILFSLLLPETELHSDSYYHDLIAKGIVQGEGYHEGNLYAYRTPLYPFFLSLVYMVFGGFPDSYYVVIFIQTLIGILSIFYLYKLSLELFKDKTKAKVAALLFCLFPTFIALNAKLLNETLFFGLFLPGFYHLYKSLKKLEIAEGIIGGILLGLSALTREITVYFIPFVLLFLFFAQQKSIKKKIVLSLCIIVCFGSVLTPWLIRNYRIFNAPLITTNGGINFYAGNNIEATGFYKWKLPEGAIWVNNIDTSKMSLHSVHQIELSTGKKGYSQGLDFIKRNPLKFTLLSVKRFIFFWLPPLTDLEEIKLSIGSIFRILRFIFTILIVILGLAGITDVFLKKRFSFSLILSWIAYTTLFHSLLIVNHRYSLTMIPFLCILSVIPIFNIAAKLLKNDTFTSNK